MNFLTHSVSEWRFDDIRLSGISRAQISEVEFLEPKWLLSLNSFLHILFFWTFHIHRIGAEKKIRFHMSFWQISVKLQLQHYSMKISRWIKINILILTSLIQWWFSTLPSDTSDTLKVHSKYHITIYIYIYIIRYNDDHKPWKF